MLVANRTGDCGPLDESGVEAISASSWLIGFELMVVPKLNVGVIFDIGIADCAKVPRSIVGGSHTCGYFDDPLGEAQSIDYE